MVEDDPIIKRIPVYVNRSELGDIEFNVFQFMTRPYYRPYGDQGDLESVLRRETQKTFMMKYKLTKNENFDEEHLDTINDLYGLEPGDDIKNVITSRNVSKPPSPKMFGHSSDRVRVRQNPNTLTNYSSALAVLRDGKLFVTPKVFIQQFRPDLASANFQDSEDKLADNPATQATAQGQASERQVLSNHTLWKLQESESWNEIVDNYDSESMQANSMIRKLSKVPMSKDEDPVELVVPFCTNWVSYLKDLTTVNLEAEEAKGTKVDISLGSLAELAPKEQVKMVMRNLIIAPFDLIKTKLPNDFKDEALLDDLLEICVIVQGNFVERSDLMIDDLLVDIEPPAQINRVDFLHYSASVRDLLLSIFADSVNGEPRDVSPGQVIKIPAFAPFRASGVVGSIFKKTLELIFNNISSLHERTFKLKCEPDKRMLNIDKVAAEAEELKKNTNNLVKEILPAAFKKLAPQKK
eukprot:GHVH01012131.1.p1 GENE.GHVH01012131.1~~GHVH01012131.1.p1  ORF type:complete len:466 (+),score=80.80 GHVH01012131.1:64-1461(+)